MSAAFLGFCLAVRGDKRMHMPVDVGFMSRDDHLPQIKEEIEERVSAPQPLSPTSIEFTSSSESDEQETLLSRFSVPSTQRSHFLGSLWFRSLDFSYKARVSILIYAVLQEVTLPTVFMLPLLVSPYHVMCTGEQVRLWEAKSITVMVVGNIVSCMVPLYVFSVGLRSRRWAWTATIMVVFSALLLSLLVVLGSNLSENGLAPQWLCIAGLSLVLDWGPGEAVGAGTRVLLTRAAGKHLILSWASFFMNVKTV